MKEVVIVSAVRTPIGSFGGSLSKVSALELGVTAAKGAIEKAGIDPKLIDTAIIGNVLSAGLGQNIARQISLKAGMKVESSSLTINKVCGSGLRAVSMAAQFIMLGDSEIVLAGGSESMSNAPYVLNDMRWGARMGDTKAVDTMINDALTDAFNEYHMGITAENIASQWNLTREMQDEFAVKSQNKAEKAIKEGRFKDEIIPVIIKSRKGDTCVDQDEYPKSGMTIEKMEKLRTAFKKDGSVTAGNASGINDGAAMLLVMSKEKAEELGLEVLATIVSYSSAGVDPSIMGYGPVPSTQSALKKASMTIDQIELVEANEAFASQSLSVVKDLGINPDIVNVNGGAIALGHPVGASGARILVTLLHEMKKRDSKTGLATLCIGGGMGTALIVKR